MATASPKRKNTFISDEPSPFDYLDYGPYVKALVHLIAARETQTPLTLGISGSWGSGKTTLMYLMEKEIEARASKGDEEKGQQEEKDQKEEKGLVLKCLRINVWEVSQHGEGGQALLQALFTKVRDSLSMFRRVTFSWYLLLDRLNFNALLRQIAVNSYRILIVIAPLLAVRLINMPRPESVSAEVDKIGGLSAGVSLLLGVWLIVKPIVEAVREKVSLDLGAVINDAPYEIRISALQKLQTHFERLVGDWVGEDGRLVVFIDDLDRCKPDRIAETLEALKLFATTKRCVYVLGIDQDVVARSIQAKYKDITGGAGDELYLEGVRYLEKIVQLPFLLPQIELTDIRGYVESFNADWPHVGCADIFIEGLPPNPRQLKRAINVFFLLWKLAENRREKLGGTVTHLRLAKIVALQTAYPDLFEWFKKAPHLIKDLETYYKGDEEGRKAIEHKQMDESTRFAAASMRSGLKTLFALHEDNDDATFSKLEPRDLAAFFSLTRSVTLTVRADQNAIAKSSGSVTGGQALYQLPPPPSDFTGRSAELAELTSKLDQDGITIAGFNGLGGIGKTTLALKLADQLKARYPDAQFYLDLKGASSNPLDVTEALGHVIRAYDPTAKLPDSEAELQGLYRSVLQGQRALLLIDNAASAEHVYPLIPPTGCILLVTSRTHFTLPGLFVKNLEPLSPEDARDLLLAIAPRLGNHADEIAALCGYFPLALRLAGSAMLKFANLAPADYARRLQDGKGRVELIEASLNLSYELLNEKLQKWWCRLSVFPNAFEEKAAAAVWNLEVEKARDALGELIAASMVEWNETAERCRLLDLARLFADSRLSASERAHVQKLHATHYESVLAAANEFYLNGGDAINDGLSLFDLERENIEAGQAWAAAKVDTNDQAAELCILYPLVGVYVLMLRQDAHERIRWLETAISAARRLEERQYEAYALGNLGLAYEDLRETSRAIELYEQLRHIAREIGDRGEEGNALGNLGRAYADLGETKRAIEADQQALLIFREMKNRRREGVVLGNLGLAYANLGETKRAIEVHEQALLVVRETGDRRSEGVVLGNLGQAYADSGETERAIEVFERSLAVTREIGDRIAEGNTLGNLGRAYADLGETERAIEVYERRLEIARETGDRRGESNGLFNKSLALDKLHKRDQAIVHAQAALTIYEQIKDPSASKVRIKLAEWQTAPE